MYHGSLLEQLVSPLQPFTNEDKLIKQLRERNCKRASKRARRSSDPLFKHRSVPFFRRNLYSMYTNIIQQMPSSQWQRLFIHHSERRKVMKARLNSSGQPLLCIRILSDAWSCLHRSSTASSPPTLTPTAIKTWPLSNSCHMVKHTGSPVTYSCPPTLWLSNNYLAAIRCCRVRERWEKCLPVCSARHWNNPRRPCDYCPFPLGKKSLVHRFRRD